jgi:hypothetical protein
VQWVLDDTSAELREATATELLAVVEAERTAAAAEPAPAQGTTTADLRAHGLLGPAVRAEIRRRVVLEIVAPCARALVVKSRARTAPARSDVSALAPVAHASPAPA